MSERKVPVEIPVHVRSKLEDIEIIGQEVIDHATNLLDGSHAPVPIGVQGFAAEVRRRLFDIVQQAKTLREANDANALD